MFRLTNIAKRSDKNYFESKEDNSDKNEFESKKDIDPSVANLSHTLSGWLQCFDIQQKWQWII